MQFTGVDKFFRGKIYQYKKCIFLEKKRLQRTGTTYKTRLQFPPPPPELAFQFTYSSMECPLYSFIISMASVTFHQGIAGSIIQDGRRLRSSELYIYWNDNCGSNFEANMAEIEARLVGMIQAPTRIFTRIKFQKSAFIFR